MPEPADEQILLVGGPLDGAFELVPMGSYELVIAGIAEDFIYRRDFDSPSRFRFTTIVTHGRP